MQSVSLAWIGRPLRILYRTQVAEAACVQYVCSKKWYVSLAYSTHLCSLCPYAFYAALNKQRQRVVRNGSQRYVVRGTYSPGS